MIGQTISHYRILGKLGGGGMGVVYEAEDLRLGRHVALKFLPENLVGDPKTLERFVREARAASLLNHPNICTIHDIQDHNGQPFIVMEKLEGESLKQRIKEKKLDTDEMLDIALQVADALTASHEKGIIHRDIKPANIFLTTSGSVKVLDFGLAKLTRDQRLGTATDTGVEDSLTAVGVIPGTAVYMSPEQARSEELDARSDLFSFGVVIYEMATGKKPFTGTNIVTTLDAVLHQKPVSPLAVNPELPTELEGIIGKAMEKDRTQRYQSAAEMKADLQRLKRQTESGLARVGPRPPSPIKAVTKTFQTTSPRQTYLMLGMAGLLIAVLAAVGAWWLKHRGAAAALDKDSIAVLPLQNESGDSSLDYLRFALADEISSLLTYTRSLDVRPTASTRKYSAADVDPQKAGKELRVGTVVTGHYLREGDKLAVTLEAISIRSDTVLWQSTTEAKQQDLIGLQSSLSTKVRQGLLPVLGAATDYLETGTRPKSAEAYDLFLKSAALTRDAAPNRRAIEMLEKVVGMDPQYAPAWEGLCTREYYDARYATGGEEMFQRSSTSCERALNLDPNLTIAAGQLINNRVERGELGKAYLEAKELVKRRPKSASAHFTLSYVLRYAGMLEDATGECDTAIKLEPKAYSLRSCAAAFMELGKTQRALQFVNLDAGSEWANYMIPFILIRDGKLDEARDALKKTPTNPRYNRDLLTACLQPKPPDTMQSLVDQSQVTVATASDPESTYYLGALMAFCGRKPEAIHLLKMAIEQNYCAYEALLNDPLLDRVRGTPEFDQLLDPAKYCQRQVKEAGRE
jgi:serine/threonine protein kinase/tetratricopeptide (TPR) repeat protein